MKRIRNIDAMVCSIEHGFDAYLKSRPRNASNRFGPMKYSELRQYMFGRLTLSDVSKGFSDIGILNANTGKCLPKKSLVWAYESKRVAMEFVKDLFIKEFLSDGNRFCPYCWKTELLYFADLSEKNRISNSPRLFDLDHFFPKNFTGWIYAHLAVNLYNWIPTCMTCNQRLKKTTDPLFDTNVWEEVFHPYYGLLYRDPQTGFVRVNDVNFDDKYELTLWSKCIFKTKHARFFHLNDIYSYSEWTRRDILFVRDKMDRLLVEKRLNPWRFVSDKDQRIKAYFDMYYPETEFDFLNFSHGKLKKDWITNLKNGTYI